MAQNVGITDRLAPNRPDQFTKNYCEENIYWLAHRHSKEHNSLRNLFVVFISNESQQVPIWSQRSSIRPDQLAVWDYHVILLALTHSKETLTSTTAPLIFDLDSSLPCPVSLAQYIQHALVITSSDLPEMHRRLFRVIPAAEYLANFSSDRSHMLKHKTSEIASAGGTDATTAKNNNNDGEYMSAPPRYPCIVSTSGETNTFPRYLEMPSFNKAVNDWKASPLKNSINRDDGGGGGVELGCELAYGVVLTEDAFLEFARETTLL